MESLESIQRMMDMLGQDLHTMQQLLQERRVGHGAQGYLKNVLDEVTGWRQLGQEGLKLAQSFASEMAKTFGTSAENLAECFAAHGEDLGYVFAAHGLDLGYSFAYHGLDLGYEFAAKGETVGPMANRVLFMAVQIGVMADRIGEMANRILFMADRIVEFGDKIVYESQLIVYTEQLILNESVLIEQVAAMVARTLLALAALASGDSAGFMALIEQSDQHALDLIYQNLNRMLDHMQVYALAVLEQEERNRAREAQTLAHELLLRESTMSANNCYCPSFGAEPAPPPPPDAVPPYPPTPPIPAYPPVPPYPPCPPDAADSPLPAAAD